MAALECGPRARDRVELRIAAAFWVAAGTTSLLCGSFVDWLPYAVPVGGVALLWPIVRRKAWAPRLLEWLPFPLVLVTYDMLHAVAGRCWNWTLDPWLRGVDRALFGTDVAKALEPLVAPPLTTFLAACYASYYVVLLAVGVRWYLQGRRLAFREFMVAETGALFVGYFGYLFLPAIGPHVYFHASEFTVPLTGDFIGPVIRSRALQHGGLNPRDAFPSLHTANAVTLLLMAWRHERRLLWFVTVPMLGLIVATVYLRFHYVADVLAGAALAVAWQFATIALVRREAGARGRSG